MIHLCSKVNNCCFLLLFTHYLKGHGLGLTLSLLKKYVVIYLNLKMPIENAILVKNTQRMQTGKHVHAIDSA